MATTKSNRVTNVQVPGDTPAAAPETVQPTPPIAGAKPEMTLADEAKPAPRNYREMHAADIDPTTLSAPVMTLDGYLCPATPEKK